MKASRSVDGEQVTSNRKLTIDHGALNQIKPITINQSKFFKSYYNSQIMLLSGYAGTGKTFIAMYKALDEVLGFNSFRQVVIVRSAVPTREIGHLPGDIDEKTDIYQAPYVSICEELFNRRDAYSRLVEQKVIKFIITSFVRGITLEDSIVIVDECQNLTDHELNSIITRMGKNTRIIFCGDYLQSDLKKHETGMKKLVGTLRYLEGCTEVEFGTGDIVRSDLVKDYIIARAKYEADNPS